MQDRGKRLFGDRTGGIPLLGVVADSGQIARLARRAEIDFLLALGAGPYRNDGVSPLAAGLPFQNSNDLTEHLVHRILPGVEGTPVIAGLLASDPTCDLDDRLLRLTDLGVAGVTNYPSASALDGSFREIFEAEANGLDAELDLLARARQLGLAAVGFIGADPATAARFAKADLDALILTPGLTRFWADIRERRDKLQHAVRQLNEGIAAARQADARLPCLVFGGPITMPEDLEQVYRQCPADGFVGGSVFGRLPVEAAVGATLRRFKAVGFPRAAEPGAGQGAILGTSDGMRRLFRLLERAARCDLNVCIEGESGVGKELIATQIHRLSARAHGPLVTLNCGAIPDTLLESELFGHEKGAFTGADHRRLGKFELADKGTLFLDEVGDLSPHGQVALLRAIQQREITRVGGNTSIQVDHRILSATNKPLADLVEQGRFRADLYYRLNQLTLTVPPLRERADDLPLLVTPVLAGLRAQLGRDVLDVAPEFYAKLARHAWPGNVRELHHVLCQAALLEDGPVLHGTHFTPRESGVVAPPADPRRRKLEAALSAAGGNKSHAAAALGISRKTLYAWLREFADKPTV